jgi:hypothetical protein
MRTIMLAALLMSCSAHAEWKNVAGEWDQYRLNDTQMGWFKGVHNKQNVPCCSIADGHPTEQRRGANGDYQVPDPRILHKGEWLDVPTTAMTNPANNPVGVATVWYSITGTPDNPQADIFVRCFVPEAET